MKIERPATEVAQSINAARRPLLGTIFISPSEPRLRAGWRLLLQTLLELVIVVTLSIAMILVPGYLLSAYADMQTLPGLGLGELKGLVAITLSVLVARRFLDHRSLAGLGLAISPRTLRDLAVGAGIGAIMMALLFVSNLLLGWIAIDGFAWSHDSPQAIAINLLGFLAVYLLVAWNEELMSRGYHLQTIASGMNMLWAVILSSAVFGMMHLLNSNGSWAGAVGCTLAGVLLCFAYVRSGQLWLGIGLHTTWNFFEGVVFGFPVSGLNNYRLVRIAIHGPQAWTGGPFGPEAGWLIVPIIAVGAALIHAYGGRNRSPDAPTTNAAV